MNRRQAAPAKRRNRLLDWLFGTPGSPAQPRSSTPAFGSDDDAQAALLGPRRPASAREVAAPPERPQAVADQPQIPRDMYRVNVNLPANLEVSDDKIVPVRITNISGTGAAILYDSSEPLPEGAHWLDLALPNRQKAFELEVALVRSRLHTGAQGQDQYILHVQFPTIRRNEQDAIIAYINNLRLYEDKQFTVAAKVMLEVVTGRRRFAKFNGETIEIRPDLMRLMMDDFDAIAGAEVMLTIMAPHFADHLDVDEVKIEKVDIVGPRKAEVEVSLAKPDDKVLLFIRKHYPGVAKSRR